MLMVIFGKFITDNLQIKQELLLDSQYIYLHSLLGMGSDALRRGIDL